MLAVLESRIRRLRRLANQTDELATPNRLSVAAWGKKYLPAYFQLPLSSFHVWLTGELDTLHERRGTKQAVIAPRGAAKSTWVSLTYPLYTAVHGLESYIQIVSDTHGQARLWLEGIKAELEDNADLADDYPSVVGEGDCWRQDRLRLRNGVVIEAMGTGSKIRGRRNRAERPSLIILDDPENEDHVTSQVRREKTKRWFNRAVLNAGTTRTNVIVLGTTLQADCLVVGLQKTPGWQGRVFRSIIEWPKRMDLWAEWEAIFNNWDRPDREEAALAFYRQHEAEMNE